MRGNFVEVKTYTLVSLPRFYRLQVAILQKCSFGRSWLRSRRPAAVDFAYWGLNLGKVAIILMRGPRPWKEGNEQ
mgnify:CR=1 FL=1